VKTKAVIYLFFFVVFSLFAEGKIFIPMDSSQGEQLRAYGVTYYCLSLGLKAKLLLNYRGGSFLLPNDTDVLKKALSLGVDYSILTSEKETEIMQVIATSNMESLHLEKAPKIAVYTPLSAKPWDDAVTMALEYADIPYTKIYDEKLLNGDLSSFDWLHLHHEDFTAQYSKFYSSFRNALWYKNAVASSRVLAEKLGYKSVADEKKAVALKIADFVKKGGFLFAMCYSSETLDIALAALDIDIVPSEIDNTPVTNNYNNKLDYSRCLAFKDFSVNTNPFVGYVSDIDYNHVNSRERILARPFTLFEFSAKFDEIPTLLTQNSKRTIKGFYGLTTSYRKKCLKKGIVVLGDIDKESRKYIYGKYGKGSFTFYGGHDPEDYSHAVYDKPTDLSLHPDSPGYRLILNNILFPAAQKKKLKT